MTLGDAVDRALGGPDRFISDHCRNDRHGVCLKFYGGRSCDCTDCEHPMVTPPRRPSLTAKQDSVLRRLRTTSRDLAEIDGPRWGWVRLGLIGERRTLNVLVEKGYVEAREIGGPRGGRYMQYRPIQSNPGGRR